MRHQDNIKGLAFMEAILAPVPSWDMFPQAARELFQGFRTPGVGWDMIVNQNMFVEQVLPMAVVRELSQAEMDHYREPFKEPVSRKPVWRWPNEIPIAGEPQEVVDAVSSYNQWLQQSDLPKLLFYGTPGALVSPQMVEWTKLNLQNLDTVDIGPGIHFLQEDNPDLIGAELAKWYGKL